MTVQLEDQQLEIIRNILALHDVAPLVFGSRAKGTARPLSDLDLLVTEQISKIDHERLKEAFEESDLPFKVDIVLESTMEKSFREAIDEDLVALE